ncbi:radical SAM family heme chaperone HemW [Paraflavisolibacter sp. H34]|uniref:radical SAM family heme chaperone HemW n=1 Tax=Huijunlia imazamoxiresistens TaxID=3127457 RepID=UPI003018B2D0
MAGIYLHIPFCRQACAYCNFHFTTSLRYKDDLVGALLHETGLQQHFLEGASVSTIYFGGGTPSLLDVGDCRRLLDRIRQTFPVAADAEITLEANPDDITADKLAGWGEAGINRLSIGIQSFFEEELRWMNRAHNAGQARRCIELSQEAGFHNLSIDLIYGSPLLSDDMWAQNVSTALGYGVPHLSCYALTVEEKTPLHQQIIRHRKEDVDADKQARQFLQLMHRLKEGGYEHYEVSNFARPGFRSRHNSSYWKGEKYLGLGPSAHSYDGLKRQWNIANNTRYIHSIVQGVLPTEAEVLTPVQQLNEYIMIALRTMEGMDLERIRSSWGTAQAAATEQRLARYQAAGLLTRTGSRVQLTEEGMLRADGIASDLFQE